MGTELDALGFVGTLWDVGELAAFVIDGRGAGAFEFEEIELGQDTFEWGREGERAGVNGGGRRGLMVYG